MDPKRPIYSDPPLPLRRHEFERHTSMHYPCKHCGQDMLGPYTPECVSEKGNAVPTPESQVKP